MSINTFLDKAPRFILYGLIFLMPVFFLPFTTIPIDFNKQMLLAVAVLAASLLWMIDILRQGTIRFRVHILFIPLFLFIIVGAISSYASGAFTHSFLGSSAEPDAFFNLLLLAVVFFLVASILRERVHIFNAITLIILSAVLNSIFLFVHSVFPSILPWEFTHAPSFNPFGSFYAFSIYAGGAFVLAIWLLSYRPYRTYKAYLFSAAALVLFLSLVFINFWIAWIGVAIGMFILVYYLCYRLKDRRIFPVVLPLFIFMVALALLFIEVPFSRLGNFPSEVRLSNKTTMDIAKNTTSASAKSFLFGSGPATFVNQYNLYRSPTVNNTPFWDAAFSQGGWAVTGFFIVTGVVGGSLILLFLSLFVGFGVKSVLDSCAVKKRQDERFFPSPMVFAGGLCFVISWLLYQIHFPLFFAGFIVFALYVALRGKWKEIKFTKSPQGTFWGMMGGVIVLIVFILGFYNVGKSYYAELSYERGVRYANMNDLVQAIPFLEEATEANDLDKYWRKRSQVLFLQSSRVFKNQSLPADKRNSAMQQGILAAEFAVRNSTKVNPNNSVNFEQFGDFYRNIINISENAFGFAISNYDKAAELNPQSPYIPLNKAWAYLANSQRIKAELDALRGQLALAEKGEGEAEELQKRIDVLETEYTEALKGVLREAQEALKLKRDFAPAIELFSEAAKLVK